MCLEHMGYKSCPSESSETLHGNSNSNSQPAPLANGATHGTLRNLAWELKFQSPRCPPGQRSLTQNPQKPCMGIKIPIADLAPWPTEPYTEHSETVHAKSNSSAQPGPLTSGALHGTLKNPAWELKFQFPTCTPGQRSEFRDRPIGHKIGAKWPVTESVRNARIP